MKVTKYFNGTFVGLCLITFVNAAINNDNKKGYGSLYADERDSMKLPGLKRPFCNAFTGCGRKRSYVDVDSGDTATSNNLNDSTVSIPLKLYQILMNNLNKKIRQSIQDKIAIAKNDDINYNNEDYFISLNKQPIRKRYN